MLNIICYDLYDNQITRLYQYDTDRVLVFKQLQTSPLPSFKFYDCDDILVATVEPTISDANLHVTVPNALLEHAEPLRIKVYQLNESQVEELVGVIYIPVVPRSEPSDEPSYIGHIYYGVCTTAANTQDKTADIPDFSLVNGVCIRILFANEQGYDGVPTLNVGGTGAKPVMRRQFANGGMGAQRHEWAAGEVVDFVYTGEYWVIADGSRLPSIYNSNGQTAPIVLCTQAQYDTMLSNDEIEDNVLYLIYASSIVS